MAGHDDELGICVDLFDGTQQLNAVHFGHTKIAEHDFMPGTLELFQGIFAVFSQGDFVTFGLENFANKFTNRDLIVCNQDIYDACSKATVGSVSSGSLVTNFAPPISGRNTFIIA